MALPSDKEQYDEYRYMLYFLRDNDCGDKSTLDQLRALWTAYCIHWELPTNNRDYIDTLQSLKYLVAMDNQDILPQFNSFMGEYL